MMLMGRVSHEGRENICVKFDLTENLSVKINAQVIYLKLLVKLVIIWVKLYNTSLNSFVDRFCALAVDK